MESFFYVFLLRIRGKILKKLSLDGWRFNEKDGRA